MNLGLAWGIESLALLDPFYFGASGIIISFFIWFTISYFSVRGKVDKALEESLKLMGYVFGLGLLISFTGLPSMWVGLGMVLSFVYSTKYLFKWNWRRTIFVLFITLLVLGFFVLLPESMKWIFFVLILISVLLIESQARMRKKKAEEKKED